MFEPITLTVAELAARWNRTPKQILEFAQHLGVPLYFNYGCLAFEETDSWHRSAGDQWEVQERDFLAKAVDSREEQIIRARDGMLSQWEQLPAGGVPELRSEINALKSKLRFIDELLERREVERAQCELGFLRPGPGTLFDIANNGETPFPRWAFHSAGEIATRVVHDERGNPFLEWVGRRMILEARNDGDPRWKRTLSVEDLFASVAEVKAIEAKSVPAVQAFRTLAPAADVPLTPKAVRPWLLETPIRYQGYRKPVYDVLKAAHIANVAMPSARDVLDALKTTLPPEVIEVLPDGLKYYDASGDAKSAGLRDIQKTIDRLARYSPDSPATVPTRPTS